MPRHALGRTDLHLGDAKAWPLGVVGSAFDLIEMPSILDRMHGPRSVASIRWKLVIIRQR
jgi:hypothetical protein